MTRVRRKIAFTLPLLLLLAVVFWMMRERTPFGKRNTSFSVAGKEIRRIEFFEGEKKLVLSLKEGTWLANDEFEARKSTVSGLLKVLDGMTIKSPVSPEMFASEVEKAGTVPVKVHVYGKFRILRSFLVYKTASNRYGNIMKIRPAAKPFIVWVKGNETSIGEFFTADELYWRPNSLVRLLPGDIRSVTVSYPGDSESSFLLELTGSRFKLAGSNGEPVECDSVNARRFVSYFTNIPYESWVKESADSVRKALAGHFAEITVTDVRGKSVNLRLFEKSIVQSGALVKDTDRAYAILNEGRDIFILRYFDIDPVLRRLNYLRRES